MPDLKRIPLRGSWDAPTRTLSPDAPADDGTAKDQREPTCPA